MRFSFTHPPSQNPHRARPRSSKITPRRSHTLGVPPEAPVLKPLWVGEYKHKQTAQAAQEEVEVEEEEANFKRSI